MRVFFPILFVTLVLTLHFAQAAPSVDHDPEPIPGPLHHTDSAPQSLDPSARESLDWKSTSPLTDTEKKEVRIESAEPLTKSYNWSLRATFFGGAVSETNASEQTYVYGLRGDFNKDTAGTWQGEVDVNSQNLMLVSVARKNYFLLERVAMPYYRLGVGEIMDSSEGIGSVINLKKIQALAAVGLDDLFLFSQRLQCEAGVGFADIGPQFEFSLGIAF